MNVLSVHGWILDQSRMSGEPWKVHSVYRQTVCLNTTACLVILTTKCNGPVTVLVSKPMPKFKVGQMVFPQALLDGGGYKIWAPPEYTITKGCSDSLCGRLSEVYRYIGNSCLLIEPYLNRFKEAMNLFKEHFPLVRPGAELLIGLGPGLTPSGDDFLTGYCHVLYHLGIRGLWKQLSFITDQTNDISREMLQWSCHGIVISYWEDILRVLAGDSGPEEFQLILQRALSVGSSSGADYLLGCYAGLSILKEFN